MSVHHPVAEFFAFGHHVEHFWGEKFGDETLVVIMDLLGAVELPDDISDGGFGFDRPVVGFDNVQSILPLGAFVEMREHYAFAIFFVAIGALAMGMILRGMGFSCQWVVFPSDDKPSSMRM